MISMYRVIFRNGIDEKIYQRDIEYDSNDTVTAFGQAIITALVDFQMNSDLNVDCIESVECKNLGRPM